MSHDTSHDAGRATTSIDPALVEQFGRDGVVVVPDVFTDDELDRFGEAVDAAVAADTADDDRAVTEKSRYEQSFQQCLNLWVRYPDVLPWSCHRRPASIAARLLGAAAVRLWHDQALYKEPGGRITDPHQDHPYWPIVETTQVTAWIPFDGSTIASGAMSYWPGSHRLGIDRFVDIFGEETPADIGGTAELSAIEPITVEVPRGGVAFHHGLTAHRANANATSDTRRVHTMIYTSDGCHRTDTDQGHPSVDFDGIEPGAVIDGTMTPLVWAAGREVPQPNSPPGAAEFYERINTHRRERRRR